MLEKTLENSLDCKEIQPVHRKGDQSWVFIGWTDVEAETPILWLPDVKNWLIGKDFDAGRDWGQKEKGTTEDEMAGWHHQLHGHEFEWTLGVSDGQGGLACYDSCGRKESDMTERPNWTELNAPILISWFSWFYCGLYENVLVYKRSTLIYLEMTVHQIESLGEKFIFIALATFLYVILLKYKK